MEKEIKLANGECFEQDGQMYVSDLLGTEEGGWLSKPNTARLDSISLMEINNKLLELPQFEATPAADSIRRHTMNNEFDKFIEGKNTHKNTLDDDMFFFLTTDEEKTWLRNELTLNDLYEKKASRKLRHTFSAIIENQIYVADREIISVWQNSHRELEYCGVIYWDEVQESPLRDVQAFKYHCFPLRKIVDFHNKITILHGLTEAICSISTGEYYFTYSDQSGGWPCDALMKNRDFNKLQQETLKVVLNAFSEMPEGYYGTACHRDNLQRELLALDAARQLEEDWEKAPKRPIYDDATGEVAAWERTDIED